MPAALSHVRALRTSIIIYCLISMVPNKLPWAFKDVQLRFVRMAHHSEDNPVHHVRAQDMDDSNTRKANLRAKFIGAALPTG
jgi:hypothetical protein